MVDVVDKVTRSRMMSGIRGKDTKPELALRRALHRLGFRFRLHTPLPGRPDIVLPKHRTVVLVHGCFWDRHKRCTFATTPASTVAFWKEKFKQTIIRDRRNVKQLLKEGWRVAVVWECHIDEHGALVIAETLARWLRRTNEASPELPPIGSIRRTSGRRFATEKDRVSTARSIALTRL